MYSSIQPIYKVLSLQKMLLYTFPVNLPLPSAPGNQKSDYNNYMLVLTFFVPHINEIFL